ncbi:type IV pilus twitching motility protein PilT [Microcella frigidaquae]|uniref:Twitching motility protein PilT n=1 Tax=Microcella frigidaquae TaxID=424758 RepID=A0A840X5K4_9MICO|nr:type IV pilus twitching motility protein PilT [Microcella frigidaquae]MBB5617813.1 twitching motility protein PilT [Microcella frigidaquae]
MTDSLGLGPAVDQGGAPRRVWSVTADDGAVAVAAQAAAQAAAPPPAGPMGAPVLAPPPPVGVPTVSPLPDLATGAPHLAPPPPVGQQAYTAPPPAAPVATAATPSVTTAAVDAPPPLGAAALPAPPPLGSAQAMTGIHPALLAALDDVVARGGSDLHVAADAPPMVRVDGELTPATGSTIWSRDDVTAMLETIMNEHQREVFAREWELDFAISPRGDFRFRVNFYKDRDAMAAAFRLIPTEIKSLKQLGVPGVVAKFAALPRGLVLVTGPTGSGKSTTLAALIDLVNKTRADHIVTIEDPIEFVHRNQRALVNQREVGSDTHSFADALKRVLRQDPDVILIGELRDLETVSTALTAAETGHLVFATLHTQSAAQTIDRIIDVFPPHQQGQVRSQLALTLQGVVCQTLLPRATGQGRIIATEIMMTTGAIANLIREGKTYQITSALQAGRDAGMHTMDQHLADLVNSHMVTHEAAQAKMQDPENFNRLVHRAAPDGAPAGQPFADGFGGAR